MRCCRCSSLTMLFCQRRRRSLPPPADQHRYQRPLRIGRPSNDRLVPGTPIGELPVEATAFTVLVLYSPLDSNSVKHFGAAEFSLSLGKAFLIIPTLAFTFVAMLDRNPLHDRYGFWSWQNSRGVCGLPRLRPRRATPRLPLLRNPCGRSIPGLANFLQCWRDYFRGFRGEKGASSKAARCCMPWLLRSARPPYSRRRRAKGGHHRGEATAKGGISEGRHQGREASAKSVDHGFVVRNSNEARCLSPAPARFCCTSHHVPSIDPIPHSRPCLPRSCPPRRRRLPPSPDSYPPHTSSP